MQVCCKMRQLQAPYSQSAKGCGGISCAEKKAGDQLFDTMDANDLNKRLKELMDGLSVKVWALGSVTLGPIYGLETRFFYGGHGVDGCTSLFPAFCRQKSKSRVEARFVSSRARRQLIRATLVTGAQVFRTYNASIVLDQLLHKESASETVDEKKGDYDRANKEARPPAPASACFVWEGRHGKGWVPPAVPGRGCYGHTHTRPQNEADLYQAEVHG